MQQDYWSMSEKELAELAERFGVETIAYDDAYQPFFRRDYIIAFLMDRDSALRTRGADIRSWIALGISILAFILSLVISLLTVWNK
jgi:hypothetical protein